MNDQVDAVHGLHESVSVPNIPNEPSDAGIRKLGLHLGLLELIAGKDDETADVIG
jgi:hypothetical protein